MLDGVSGVNGVKWSEMEWNASEVEQMEREWSELRDRVAAIISSMRSRIG
jgi:hypothetical protein